MSQLKQLAFALNNYHDIHKSFPPAFVTDKNGKPLYSWRVLILPNIGENELYKRFDKNKAWDAPENIGISNTKIPFLRSHIDGTLAANETNYFCFVGPNTIFPSDRGVSMSEITDGTSNTLLLIETTGIRGSWAAPIDIDAALANLAVGNLPGQIRECYPGGIYSCFADSSTRFIKSEDFTRLLPLFIDRRDGQFRSCSELDE